MSYLFKSGTIICLDPASVESVDLRVEGGRVIERASQLAAREGEEVIGLNGKLVMPGMVCAHTHLYSAFARGMPAPPRAPLNFMEILELIWWRLDRALDEETIYWSAVAAALEAARAGTTCLFDHHASPSFIGGSLKLVREAIQKVGLRAVLCYEVTDRGGTRKRDEALDENRALLKSLNGPGLQALGAESQTPARNQTLFRGMVGAHASFTLSDRSLDACAALMNEFDAGLHIHVAEDACDVEDAREKYGLGVVERLASHGALNPRTILAHCTHLSEREIELARAAGVWFAHNPRSNMNNQVGYAPVEKFGGRVVLGTDGIGGDMFEETRTAFFRSRDAHTGLAASDWLRVLANNQRMASAAFGDDLTSLRVGSAADLVVLDYDSPTPLTTENLAWHLVFGLTSASVESVMVAGRFIVRDRASALDHEDIYAEARKASEKLWTKLKEA
ncbi:MAG TPA: putative aminohydrolase SsnA [Blastocatellia bacterium]|nr:putative aminohydrolase SsnA [Blastocatellia bacterium]